MRFRLIPHPAFPAPAGLVLGVECKFDSAGGLTICFDCDCEPSALLVPPPGNKVRTDELWRHTCGELFLADRSGRYREFNFSPSGAWASYDFSAYRKRIEILPEVSPPDLDFSLTPGGWKMWIRMLSGNTFGFDRIGLTAVIEAADTSLSYWAISHPEPNPDFHDPKGFSIPVTALGAATDKS